MGLSIMGIYAKDTLHDVLAAYANIIRHIILIVLRIIYWVVIVFRFVGPIAIIVAVNAAVAVHDLGGWALAMGERHSDFMVAMTCVESVVGYVIFCGITVVGFFLLRPVSEFFDGLYYNVKDDVII